MEILHETKAKANGLPVTNVPLVLFCDVTSGNKWNKFIECNLTLAGILGHNYYSKFYKSRLYFFSMIRN